MVLAQILADAQAESDRLDIEVCGGSAPQTETPQQHNTRMEAERKAERERRVEIYREQTVFVGGEFDGRHEPPAEGFSSADVDEHGVYLGQLAFAGMLVREGIIQPFEE